MQESSGYNPAAYEASSAPPPPLHEEVPPRSLTSTPASASAAGESLPVPALLANVSSSSPQRRKESLQKILRLCRGSTGWLQYFGQILLVVLEALADEEALIRETALVVVKEMLRSMRNTVEVRKRRSSFGVRDDRTSARRASNPRASHASPRTLYHAAGARGRQCT